MKEKSELFMVAYISKIKVENKNDQNEIDATINDIRVECVNYNNKNAVTGLLYYGDKLFLQCLEGSQSDVLETLNRIKNDNRHQDLTVLTSEEIPHRKFEKWSMKFVSNRYYVDTLLQQISSYGFEYGKLNTRYLESFNSLLKML